MESLVTIRDGKTMTSLEIAERTGKRHDNVLRTIRSMEPAWVKVTGRKFNVLTFEDVKGEKRPMFELTKTECLYIATKFNDEARAKLVIRWEELELKEIAVFDAKIRRAQASAKRRNEIALRIHDIDTSITRLMSERKSLIKERYMIDNQDYAVLSFPMFPEWDCPKAGSFPNTVVLKKEDE
ncbi:MAG: Rha family transcriptional regulator [Tannerella sp.]|nr:Rha family transcriptional regulator [Tannerella sp.]